MKSGALLDDPVGLALFLFCAVVVRIVVVVVILGVVVVILGVVVVILGVVVVILRVVVVGVVVVVTSGTGSGLLSCTVGLKSSVDTLIGSGDD